MFIAPERIRRVMCSAVDRSVPAATTKWTASSIPVKWTTVPSRSTAWATTVMDAIPSTLMKLDLKSVIIAHQKNQKTKDKKIHPVGEAKRRPPAPATMIAQKKSFAWQDHVPRLDPVPSTKIASIPPTTFHALVVLGTCIVTKKLGRVEWSVLRMEPLASQK